MPKIALAFVCILGDRLVFGCGSVVLVIRVTCSDNVFHVGDYLRLPQAARGAWKVYCKAFAIADGSVAGSLCIEANIDYNTPMLVSGEGSSAQPRAVESQDMS